MVLNLYELLLRYVDDIDLIKPDRLYIFYEYFLKFHHR